jgi:hypothetical protein
VAKKAMFFLVTLRDGHSQWERTVPAQSRDHAASLFQNEHVKAVKVDFLGWQPVETYPDPYEGVVFAASCNSQDMIIKQNDDGYSFLTTHFHRQYQKISCEIDE